MTPRTTLKAIFDSYYYNRSVYHMIELCKEIEARINKKDVEWTDDGDIIYGILVLLYGDYGTSPRSGWMSDMYKENIKIWLNEIIDDYKEILENDRKDF